MAGERQAPKDGDVLKWPVCTERGGIAPRALEEFDASLRHLSPSTKRLYLAGAKALLRAVFAAPAGPPAVASYEELSARARGVKLPKPAVPALFGKPPSPGAARKP